MAYENQTAGVAPVDESMKDAGLPEQGSSLNDQDLLDLFKKCKQESFDMFWVFERQWLRNIYYVLNRQWIYYSTADGQWKDRRLAKWIPRPVTNKCKEAVSAVRAIFTDVKLAASARPNGEDPRNVSAATTADNIAPLVHDEHEMRQVINEFDWWLLVTGNAFMHTFWDRDIKHGTITITLEECQQCHQITPSTELVGAQPKCPKCGGNSFKQAVHPQTGEPMQETRPKGRGMTLPLSPFELVFPNNHPRFSEVPYVIRRRWRVKSYYENNPTLWEQVKHLKWSKSPQDRSLEIFKSLPLQNDLGGVSSTSWSTGSGAGSQDEDGIAEYETWYKPCEKYPKGLVFRVLGDSSPIVLHEEETEGLPGEFPIQDVDGNPIFPFSHATFEHVGGRILGSGLIDPIIQKQDQLNQLDSMIQMIIQRMANPVWLEPKGAEVEKFTGEPGLVIKWNPLTVQGGAKPERIAGEGPHGSFFSIREMYLKDIEDLTGTYDIIKGARPANVSAFSAMSLLDEKSRGRFSSALQARGEAYKDWFRVAIELEREFGPEGRTKAVLLPNRKWTFQNFKNADLQGSMVIVVEDGSTVPKTNLGMRAAVEHATQLGMLNMQDPDVQYEGLKLFGLTKMVPSMDVHVQAALQKQQEFEEWINDAAKVQQAVVESMQDQEQYQQQLAMGLMIPNPPSPLDRTPLAWRPWYSPRVHKQEFIKWANSDVIRDLIRTNEQVVGLLKAHMMEIDLAAAEAMAGMVGGQQVIEQPQQKVKGNQPAGAGAAMANSNRESTQGNEPSGQGEGAQNHGPS